MADVERILERLRAIEREVAELKRRVGDDPAAARGPAAAGLDRTEAIARSREASVRALERTEHVHARAHELAEKAQALDQKARRTHRRQDDLEAAQDRARMRLEEGREPFTRPTGADGE